MVDPVIRELAVQGAFLVGYVVVALVIVLVMRRRGPVWASRASNASIFALAVTFLVFPRQDDEGFAGRAPTAFLVQCAVVVITTALGSRLSRLPAPGTIRHATIAPRRLFVARVPHQRIAALVSGGIAVTAWLAASLMATDGTTLVRRHGDESAVLQGFPGWPVMAPATCAGVVLAAAAAWALREIRDRPRIAEPTDTLLRARDASRVLRATTFGFAVAGSVALFAIAGDMNEVSQLLRGASETAPRSPWDFYQWTAFALYAPAVALIFVALFALGGSVGSREELAAIDTAPLDPSAAPDGALPPQSKAHS
ncbi:hypothetical protein N802_13155 [Knoellia sinensis KCTC 19936]|uniref:Uncharacterized protein n=1 Tax=Knoellia sinensis KCTC 19936 TaxID=1385520 RepID=A0A0A0JBA5_9MICO|nr:hypothetical protein [Knoellia sinensis]KGN34428.1 hypothetical protein N802_13155 [Knoellia sinensis KCTC 19936]